MANTRFPPDAEAEPPSALLDDRGVTPSIAPAKAAVSIVSTPCPAIAGPTPPSPTSASASATMQHDDDDDDDDDGDVCLVAELDDDGITWSRLEKGKAPEIAPGIFRAYDSVEDEPQSTSNLSLALPEAADGQEGSPSSNKDGAAPNSPSSPPRSLTAVASDPTPKEVADGDHASVSGEEEGKEEADADDASSDGFQPDEIDDDAYLDEYFPDSDDERQKAKGNQDSNKSGSSAGENESGSSVEEPLRFRDAVGRNFVFPWEKVKTYQGMLRLITAACNGIYPISQRVLLRQYDLLINLPVSMDVSGNTSTPSSSTTTTTQQQGEQQHQQQSSSIVVVPELWEHMIRPGMIVRMSMWPLPAPQFAPGQGRGRGRGGGNPGGLLNWMTGSPAGRGGGGPVPGGHPPPPQQMPMQYTGMPVIVDAAHNRIIGPKPRAFRSRRGPR
ncbi:hypothetical protein F5Y17DRAFT_120959 [Xylariaceae sp. FL0594]|nr:hypothetical protein F5Y17DRAFT_120959 [Xylariaceae sp. FL0594]